MEVGPNLVGSTPSEGVIVYTRYILYYFLSYPFLFLSSKIDATLFQRPILLMLW